MNDDLVRRLLIAADRADTVFDVDFASPWREAADRIEQLEAALREKNNIAYVIDSHGISHDTFTIVYRAALGEKKDGNV